MLCSNILMKNFGSLSRPVSVLFKGIACTRGFSRCTLLSTAAKNVAVSRSDRIMTIAINRPSKKNCVDRSTAKELYSAFTTFEEDSSVSVGILKGNGGTFCAGYDLNEVALLKEEDADWKEMVKDLNFSNGHAPMGPSRLALTKPMIAAVSGYAVAGGLELALLCDLRVAEEDAVFGVFCRKHGVPLIDGGTVRLQRLIGLSRALDLILSGRPVKADEAYAIGLVNRVAPKGNSYQVAMELAQEIAQFPQECMRADRRSVYHAAYDSNSMEDALEFEYENGVGVILKESVTGAKKFIS